MSGLSELLPRRANENVRAALADTRVVVINGARQTGKSTLARLIMEGFPGAELRYLDEAAVRSAAQADPALFVRHDGLLVLDEVQRVPELLLAIKHAVDVEPRPGRFLLTGSARLLALRDIPDLLPGRLETIELWPLSQGEIDRTAECFVDVLFEHGAEQMVAQTVTQTVTQSVLHREDYLERALRGGYPEAVRRTDLGRRARFFESYVSDLISRDVRQVAEIERPADMRRLLNLISASMATLSVP
ncbi:MAG: ATP-binding protein, partial [Pseudonocardiaceae bacterium]